MKFWTTLVSPIAQAVHVKDGEIVAQIPEKSPQTPVARVAALGEYIGQLIVTRHASFELWDRTGDFCQKCFYHKLIYACHAAIQWGNDVLLCSSGHDLFFIMDIHGHVKWTWWGSQNGIGGVNHHLFADDWRTQHVSGKSFKIPGGAHFNSLSRHEDGFLTSACNTGQIVKVRPYNDGYEEIARIKEHGIHSPIIHEGRLIYGTERGIIDDGIRVLPELSWVKYIESTSTGFALTYSEGVVRTDKAWNIIESVTLPAPFRLVFLEP